MNLLAFFGMPGWAELLIIAGIALLLFGNRLPTVMRNLGRGIVEFKKGTQELEDDVEQATKTGDDSSVSPTDET